MLLFTAVKVYHKREVHKYLEPAALRLIFFEMGEAFGARRRCPKITEISLKLSLNVLVLLCEILILSGSLFTPILFVSLVI